MPRAAISRACAICRPTSSSRTASPMRRRRRHGRRSARIGHVAKGRGRPPRRHPCIVSHGRPMHATVLLGPLTASRENNFLLIRLSAALAVVVFHSYALLAQSSNDPLTRLTGTGDLGAVGVHTFFFVSGFLVAKSWSDRDGVVRFVMARVL